MHQDANTNTLFQVAISTAMAGSRGATKGAPMTPLPRRQKPDGVEGSEVRYPDNWRGLRLYWHKLGCHYLSSVDRNSTSLGTPQKAGDNEERVWPFYRMALRGTVQFSPWRGRAGRVCPNSTGDHQQLRWSSHAPQEAIPPLERYGDSAV